MEPNGRPETSQVCVCYSESQLFILIEKPVTRFQCRLAEFVYRICDSFIVYYQSLCPHKVTVMLFCFFFQGMSAIHWAVDGGHVGVVYYSLNEGANVSTK